MNKFKKFAGLLLALVMLLTMAAPAMAATITITGGATGSEYKAWKLLNATNAVDTDGTGSTRYAYTVNTKYSTALQNVTGKTTDAEIVAYIAALNADGMRTFADAMYAQIGSLEADYTSSEDKFTGVDQGYYLIAETKLGTTTNGSTDTYSLVMVDTAGVDDVTVNTKESVPTVEKKVEEKNDSTGVTSTGDTADYDIGDEINFTLTGTVASNVNEYEKYYYAFHDTMENMTYVANSVKVEIGGVGYTSSFTTTWDAENKKLDIVCEDLLAIEGLTLNATSKIIVTYKATLDATAVVGGNGNDNTVKLEYSNNPYDKNEGKPSTGNTPEDTVTVFTFKLVIDKTDGATKEALKGAGFTLYKWNSTTNAWVAVGSEVKGTDMTQFTFTGLDVGKYKIVESTVPAGYNKAADIEFSVEATYVTNETTGETSVATLTVKDANGNVISGTDLTFTTTVADGKLATTIENNSGTELPSTGGMGTTLFYAVGGLLVVGAVIVMISKKRAASK